MLAETNERAAELAIINSVQEGLAAKLDMQSMYDLVGDKIHEIFDAQVVDIGLYDTKPGMISYPYSIERGVRSYDEPTSIGGFGKIVLETRSAHRSQRCGSMGLPSAGSEPGVVRASRRRRSFSRR